MFAGSCAMAAKDSSGKQKPITKAERRGRNVPSKEIGAILSAATRLRRDQPRGALGGGSRAVICVRAFGAGGVCARRKRRLSRASRAQPWLRR